MSLFISSRERNPTSIIMVTAITILQRSASPAGQLGLIMGISPGTSAAAHLP
jgi:hypothetical protein